MNDHNSIKVLGKWTIGLDFSFRHKLSLVNVFYIPKIRKNLVPANLLSMKELKIILESNKVIIIKSEMFMG